MVTVRQVPFMEMESPSVQSERKEGLERIVKVVPVWGSCLISVIAIYFSVHELGPYWLRRRGKDGIGLNWLTPD